MSTSESTGPRELHPVTLRKPNTVDQFDFRPKATEDVSDAGPKGSSVQAPVKFSPSETTESGQSEKQEENASAEKDSSKKESSGQEPASSKKTSPGKSTQPVEE